MILTYFTNLLQVSRPPPPTPSSNEWKCTNGPWSPCRLKACSYNHPEVTCVVDRTLNPIISCWHTVLSMPDMTDKLHTTLPVNMEILSMPEMTDKLHTTLPVNMEILSMPEMTDKSHTTLPVNMGVLSMPEMTDNSHITPPVNMEVLSMPEMSDKSHMTPPVNMEVLSMPEMSDKSYTTPPVNMEVLSMPNHTLLYLWTWRCRDRSGPTLSSRWRSFSG